MAILYIEFLYPIKNYFETLKDNEAAFDLGIPIIIGIVGVVIGRYYEYFILSTDAIDFFSTIITLLSILIAQV